MRTLLSALFGFLKSVNCSFNCVFMSSFISDMNIFQPTPKSKGCDGISRCFIPSTNSSIFSFTAFKCAKNALFLLFSSLYLSIYNLHRKWLKTPLMFTSVLFCKDYSDIIIHYITQISIPPIPIY